MSLQTPNVATVDRTIRGLPPKLLPLLCDPLDHSPLEWKDGALANPKSGRVYRVEDGIPILLDDSDLGPQNVKIRAMYGWMASGFDVVDRIGNVLSLGTITKARRAFAERLAIKPGDRCLYTSIGTGLDLPFLAERTPLDAIELVGLDLSREMLRQCQKKIDRRWPGPMLVQANAEQLPFADRSFDVVFHLGGINLFDRPALAVQEMARVAKPGSLVVISDETAEVAKNQYQKFNPFTRRAMKDIKTDFDPKSWVPKKAEEASYEELRITRFLGAYTLSFRASA